MESNVFKIIEKEKLRQDTTIELIASENFVSENVMKAVGSCLTNKYTEGYPNNRYYGGCKYYDELEDYCKKKWQEVFHTNYHVNVQPHSGSQANMAVYMALLNPGDTVLALKLENGGHLSHGSPVNFSGKIYNFVFYGLNNKGYIDYYDLIEKIYTHRPKIILVGASAYSRRIDFKKIYQIITQYSTPDYKPYFMVDMAHIAGLIAAGQHPSPFGYAHIITTTTHKTLRGTRGGLIFCRPSLANKIDSAVFPGIQGGSLMHVIAGKAVTAEEACSEEFRKYIIQVIRNTKVMCDEFKKLGYEIVSDGTDNHLFMIDFSNTHSNITGNEIQEVLDNYGITVNKNCVPNEKRSPKETSGIRIGCAAMTTKGLKESDFREIAKNIDVIINDYSYTKERNENNDK